ncbi:hypothetical protein VPH35_083867 [Triticum aestivum]
MRCSVDSLILGHTGHEGCHWASCATPYSFRKTTTPSPGHTPLFAASASDRLSSRQHSTCKPARRSSPLSDPVPALDPSNANPKTVAAPVKRTTSPSDTRARLVQSSSAGTAMLASGSHGHTQQHVRMCHAPRLHHGGAQQSVSFSTHPAIQAREVGMQSICRRRPWFVEFSRRSD